MATKQLPRVDLARLFGKRGYGAEVAQVRKIEAEQRAAAKTILDPMDVVGEYDAARLLQTTLGGQIRPITLDDLRTFQANVRKLGKRFKGGITAKGVVDASLKVDRDRANREIQTAVVVKAQAGVMHFLTNSGPNSDVARHHVHIDFPTFKAFSASPQDPKKLAKAMLEGPLRFECDCGRHRYWYRFIATKGGFNAGRPEVGFPKIRNPNLVGVACKHALRVMQSLLKEPPVRAKAAAMIAAAQKNDVKALVTTASEARAIAQQQVEKAASLKRRVETTVERATRISATPAAKVRALAAATREAQRRAAAAAQQGRAELQKAFAKLNAAALTKAERDRLVSMLMTAKTID
jgi:hypothetical protein